MFSDYGQTQNYQYITTVQFIPKTGILSNLFGSRFTSYEKSQLDWWMRTGGSGVFDVLSVNESSNDPHILIYTIGSNNQQLADSAIERIKPNAIKYADIIYNTKIATREALQTVANATSDIIVSTGQTLIAPIIKSFAPYIIGGLILIGGALYVYSQIQYSGLARAIRRK